MDKVQELAAMTALNHMFKKGHFDICTIDAVAKLMKVHPTAYEYNILRSLHCIDYKEMPKELYNELPTLIRSCLSLTTIYEFEHLRNQVISVSPVKRFLKMIGTGK